MKEEFCITYKDKEAGIEFSYSLDSTEDGAELIRAFYTAMTAITFSPNTIMNLMETFIYEHDTRDNKDDNQV